VSTLQHISSALNLVAQIGTTELLRFFDVQIRPEFTRSFVEDRKVIGESCLLCVGMPGATEHIYNYVPFNADPSKGYVCIFPAIQLSSHGLLLHSMQRAIGREGIIDSAKAAGGMVRDPFGDFAVYGEGALFQREANAEVTRLLAVRKQLCSLLSASQVRVPELSEA
jgi:hypothetical protein